MAMSQSSGSRKPLPQTEVLEYLNDKLGLEIYPGQIVMVAGKSGSQKSGFALHLCAALGLETLYFSGDMDLATVSSRLASWVTKKPDIAKQRVMDIQDEQAISNFTHVNIKSMSPISPVRVTQAINSHVLMTGGFPEVIVIDNLMDLEGAESDYSVQMEAMQWITMLARSTGALVLILHHATDKSDADPTTPAPRSNIKNGMSEKPEVILSVAADPSPDSKILAVNVACVKNREGPSSVDATNYCRLWARPDLCTYYTSSLEAKDGK